MGDETRWVTYDELAAALGIAPDSARRLVARKRWPRKTGNDGRARIEVPVERLTPDKPPVVGGDVQDDVSPDVGVDDRPDDTPDITPVVRVLTRHIERVEQALDEAKEERDAERAQAGELARRLAEVDAARAALESEAATLKAVLTDRDLEVGRERDRVAELTAQLVNATSQAAEAAGLRSELQERLDAAAAELQALRARPWWRRLMG